MYPRYRFNLGSILLLDAHKSTYLDASILQPTNDAGIGEPQLSDTFVSTRGLPYKANLSSLSLSRRFRLKATLDLVKAHKSDLINYITLLYSHPQQLHLAGPCRIRLLVLPNGSLSSSCIWALSVTEFVEDPMSDMDTLVIQALRDDPTA